jgi:hypothetical protein
MFIGEAIGALAAAGVRFCIVGGVAVNLHGVPRMTYDLDIVVAPEAAALAATESALAALGLRPRLAVRLADFADAEYRETMLAERNLVAVTFTDPADPLREVDVLVSPPIDAVALLARAHVVDLAGTAVAIAAIDDLIAMKRASGRAQDLADVAHLERIRAGEP